MNNYQSNNRIREAFSRARESFFNNIHYISIILGSIVVVVVIAAQSYQGTHSQRFLFVSYSYSFHNDSGSNFGFGDMQIARKDYPSAKWIKDYVALELISKDGMNGISIDSIAILNIKELSADDFMALLDDHE